MNNDSANNDPLSAALDMSPLAKSDPVQAIIAKAQDDSASADFDYARTNIYGVIEKGMEALDNLGRIADQSQHPRAYEVYSTVMKTILDANKDLLDIQKKIRDLESADEPRNQNAKSVTNNLFVGSTAELQKAIASMKNDG